MIFLKKYEIYILFDFNIDNIKSDKICKET